MSEKPAGWYYVGNSNLRYRDDYGWTEFYMDTTDPRARDWPPPEPSAMLQQLREDELRGDDKRRMLRWSALLGLARYRPRH